MSGVPPIHPAPHAAPPRRSPPAAARLHELRGRSSPGRAAMERLDRRDREPALIGAPRGVAEAFAQADFAVFGVGSVGSHLADALARLGPRRLLLVDRGRLKPQSALTHPCHPDDLGRPKAWVAGERAKAVSPATRVWIFAGAFEALPAAALAGVQFALLASDNLRAELTVGAGALEYGFDLIQGSVFGPTLSAQARVFAAHPRGKAACPACGFGEREWSDLDRDTRFSCAGPDEPGRRRPRPEDGAAPTASLPHLCAMAANLALMELTRRVVGLASAQEGSVIVDYSGHRHRTTVTPLRRTAGCPLPHDRPRAVVHSLTLASASPGELRARAGLAGVDPRRVTIGLEHHRFAGLVACACDGHPRLGRFLPDGDELGVCEGCGRERMLHPLYSASEVPLHALGAQLDRPLAELGARAPSLVRLRAETGTTLFVDTSWGALCSDRSAAADR